MASVTSPTILPSGLSKATLKSIQLGMNTSVGCPLRSASSPGLNVRDWAQNRHSAGGSHRSFTTFAQDDAAAARNQRGEAADQDRPSVSKLPAWMDNVEAGVLADIGSPMQNRSKLHGTNLLESLSGKIERRIEVVGIFPSEAAVAPLSDDVAIRLPPLAAKPSSQPSS